MSDVNSIHFFYSLSLIEHKHDHKKKLEKSEEFRMLK